MVDRLIRGIRIDWEALSAGSYVRSIPALAGLRELELGSDVTILAGENGTGKSTLLEAIAVAAGFSSEGGTLAYAHSSYDDVSDLHVALTLVRGASRPAYGQYLRAESFYSVATTVSERYNDDGLMPDWHAMSHGESFLSFLAPRRGRGLFLMDEPEAALSPRRQLELTRLVAGRAAEGSQFVIATHSPIVLATPGAQVLSFDCGEVREVDWRETDAVRVMRGFLDERL